MIKRIHGRVAGVVCAVLMTLVSVDTQALPAGFIKEKIWNAGVSQPMKVDFAQDGRVFLIQNSGQLRVFDSINDSSPTTIYTVPQIRHGLVAMAIHPDFPSTPYIYLLWHKSFSSNGEQLLRLSVDANNNVSNPTVLLDNWCVSDYNAHAYGDIQFGSDKKLYVSFADGTAPIFEQNNGPCTGGAPEGQAGAYRAQDIVVAGDPLGYNGTILRLDPITGQAAAGNPLIGKGSLEDDRIIAWGFRNPFRFTVSPINGDVYESDVGWDAWEEINKVAAPFSTAPNLGWPCYEGNYKAKIYQDNWFCNANVYGKYASATTWYAFDRSVANHNPNCANCTQAAITGIDIYPASGQFGASYAGALFFADFSQDWIRVFMPTNQQPDKTKLKVFDNTAANVTYLGIGREGALWYVDYDGNAIYRISYLTNTPLKAVLTSDATVGKAPLTVKLDATGSSGSALTYAWDLNGDGVFSDATGAKPSYTYTQAGIHIASLRAKDSFGKVAFANLPISAVGGGLDINISQPFPSTQWMPGQNIPVVGTAYLAGTNTPANNPRWVIENTHCGFNNPNACHKHPLADFNGNSGSFDTIPHEMPTWIEATFSAETAPYGAKWWNNSWSNRRWVFFNNYTNSQTLTNYPVLLTLNASRIDYNKAGTNGNSLRFVAADGVTSLQYKIATWNVGGTSTVWVRVPSIAALSVNKYIWMYYGNPDAASNQNPAAVGTTATPDSFSMYSVDETCQPIRYSTMVRIDPATTSLTVKTNIAGLPAIGLDSEVGKTTITHLVVVGSPTQAFASSPVQFNNQTATFLCWDDNDCAKNRTIIPQLGVNQTFVANYNLTQSFTKVYPQVYLRGTHTNPVFVATTKMALVANNKWQIDVTFRATTTERFKFDINGDWVTNFGDNAPANGVADANGADIKITKGTGTYRITFNDSSKVYTVTKL